MAPQYDLDLDRQYSIAIVGGGIAGLCTAIGLLHQGVSCEIYEAAPAFAEIGAGVSLGPNAGRAMKMIDPAIYEGFQRCATNNAWPDRQNLWFSFRKGEDRSSRHGAKLIDLWCEWGQISVHRARFLDELVALIPHDIAHFGKRLDDAVDEGDHVLLHFSDGTTARHDAVIACDGIKSRARHIVLGEGHPAADAVFSSKYAYRGLVPMDEAAALMGDELARNAQMYLGNGGHILTFPIENGKTLNVVAFGTKEDRKWEDEWVKPMDREAMFRDFEGWAEAPQQILSLLQKSDVWALFDMPPAPTYCSGRICLLGDSAHASTPHNGAGAGMAVEDALCMSRVLRLVYDSNDIPKAFAAFDQVRRPRTQMQVSTARESGELYDRTLPGCSDWDTIKHLLSTKQYWIWDHDHEAEIQQVEKLFIEEQLVKTWNGVMSIR